MASYSVTIFKNSGYNVINIPDRPARLRADSTSEDLDAVNIVQNRRLNSITVACTNESAQEADYIKIGDMYYAIVDFKMESEKVCTFTIVEKPLLSVGGITHNSDGSNQANFEILDGVTSRCTVSDDSWGAYTTEDPLIVPQEPLQIQTEWLKPSGGTTASGISGDPIFRESTVDLTHQLLGLDGNTYTDNETEGSVTVPATVPLPNIEGVGPQKTSFTIDGNSKSNGTSVYVVNDTTTADDAKSAGETIEEGTCAIRSLGQESGSIISQWTVPQAFLGGISITSRTAIEKPTDSSDTGTTIIGTDQVVTDIAGISGILASTISPDYATVNNKRLLYGTYNKYGMATCAGNTSEFKPEDLGDETAPSVSYKSDPRAKGKPYYRFTTINGNTEFWRNALAGSEWENVPLVYQGASGSALTRLNFDNERRIASLNKEQYEQNYTFRQLDTVKSGMQSGLAMGGAIGGVGGLLTGALTGLADIGVGMYKNDVQNQQYIDMYNAQKANELSGLYQSTDVYAPTVNFPYNADILRDVEGNGVLIYKYRMSDNDISRCDKLLTMYGYKTAEPLTLTHFQRRQKFDYVACSNVTVTGDYPKWLLDDIANELKNGIRIWHVKPDSTAYSDNPVRS